MLRKVILNQAVSASNLSPSGDFTSETAEMKQGDKEESVVMVKAKPKKKEPVSRKRN